MSDREPSLPGDRNHLHRLVSAAAKSAGVPPARVQSWLNAMVVAAILDRVRDEDDEPVFLLKGGVAMELRLKLKARATRDYDSAFRARADEVLDLLDGAIRTPYNQFAVSRGVAEPIRGTGAVRVELRLDYKGRSWGRVKLELAPVEGNMGSELDRVAAANVEALQVPVPDRVSCVSVRYQVAQKMHACTHVFESGQVNNRFRDLIDLLLVEDLVRDTVGLARTREACVDIFTVRGLHAWPPTLVVYDSWREPFAALASDNDFAPASVDEAADAVRRLISDIDAAGWPDGLGNG